MTAQRKCAHQLPYVLASGRRTGKRCAEGRATLLPIKQTGPVPPGRSIEVLGEKANQVAMEAIMLLAHGVAAAACCVSW